jgi:hypothetical protein
MAHRRAQTALSLNLHNIEDALRDHLHRARICGLDQKAQSLQTALSFLRRAQQSPEPTDVRQGFFAAMLEPPPSR